jgi:hypothetical protein
MELEFIILCETTEIIGRNQDNFFFYPVGFDVIV